MGKTMNHQYFTKTVDGTEYRIYAYTFDEREFPVLVPDNRGLLAYKGLIGNINDAIMRMEEQTDDLCARFGIGYPEGAKIMARAAREFVLKAMKAEGWKIYTEHRVFISR